MQHDANSSQTSLATRCVYDTPLVRVEEEDRLGPDSRSATYVRVSIKSGVAVAALTEDHELYLVGQNRHAVDRYCWEAVGGGLDEGESPLAAAQRELREEAGLRAGRWTYLGWADVGTAIIQSKVWFYLAQDLEQGLAQPEASEDLTIRRVPLETALQMIEAEEITYLPTITLVLMVEKRARGGGLQVVGH